MNLEFNTIPGEIKPVIDYKGINILFDTGAGTPVWSRGIELFKIHFPDAVKKNYKFILSGFGRSQDELIEFLREFSCVDNVNSDFLADVYSIPSFVLESKGDHIEWKNLNVAVTNRKAQGYHLILPSPMFGGMILSYAQDELFHKIVINSPVETKYTFIKLIDRNDSKMLSFIYTQEQ